MIQTVTFEDTFDRSRLSALSVTKQPISASTVQSRNPWLCFGNCIPEQHFAIKELFGSDKMEGNQEVEEPQVGDEETQDGSERGTEAMSFGRVVLNHFITECMRCGPTHHVGGRARGTCTVFSGAVGK